MSDFVFLYRGGTGPQSEEEGRKVFAAWTAWFERIGPSVKDPGNPFTTAGKRLDPDGAVSEETDGPSGYSIVTADSMDDALAFAKDCPALDAGSTITIHQVDPIM